MNRAPFARHLLWVLRKKNGKQLAARDANKERIQQFPIATFFKVYAKAKDVA